MKNFSCRTLIMVLILGLFLGIAPFSAKAAIEPAFVTVNSPVEGGIYYTDEAFTISLSDAFSESVSLSLRTEAQESLPPASGGTMSTMVVGGSTSRIITAFDMSSVPADRYKVILVCGEIICGETGYFDIKIRVDEEATDDSFVVATSTISVVTNVINDDAGGASASDFIVSIDAGNPSQASFPGSTASIDVVIDPSVFNVTGSENASYSISYEGCVGTALPGVIYSCTLTYNDVTYIPNGGGQGDEGGGGIIPNGQGGNDNDEGDGIIPNGQGSNDNEGDGIIPNGQGSNGPEGDPDGQGSNGDEIIAAESQNTRSGSSSTGSSRKTTIVSSATSLPALSDIGSCTYIKDYLNIKSSNDPAEVTKLQTFLLNSEGIDVAIDGVFDQVTLDAVKAFQTKYIEDVMLPWGLQTASGIVSYTTKKKINEIYCKSSFALTPEQLAAIESYKRNLSSSDDEEFVPPSNIEVGFVEPENIIAEIPAIQEPQQTQTASALDASGGFFQKIFNFFRNLF